MRDDRRRGQDRRDIDALIVAVLDGQAERRRGDRRATAPTRPATRRRRRRVPRALVAVLMAGTAALGAPDVAAATVGGQRPQCREDQRCWTWPIMGNYRRGIVTVGGRRLVVGPCRFQRIALAERIDWRRTDNLPGDALAAFRGCRMTADRAAGRGERWNG